MISVLPIIRQLDMVPGVEVYVDVAEALLENLVQDPELVPLDIDLEQRDLPAVLVPDPAQHSADRQEAPVAIGLPELGAAFHLRLLVLGGDPTPRHPVPKGPVLLRQVILPPVAWYGRDFSFGQAQPSAGRRVEHVGRAVPPHRQVVLDSTEEGT